MSEQTFRELVEKWRGIACLAPIGGKQDYSAKAFGVAADELEAALANPLEQAPHILIEARWEDEVWKVNIDKDNRNSGFACQDTLEAVLKQAVEIAIENYKFRWVVKNKRPLNPRKSTNGYGAPAAGDER